MNAKEIIEIANMELRDQLEAKEQMIKNYQKQLEKAIEGLELIANYGVSAWDIANTRHCLRQVKEFKE